jgi:hypothetical protein
MLIEKLLVRARWAALILPLFAILSACHVALNGSPDALGSSEVNGYGYASGYGR